MKVSYFEILAPETMICSTSTKNTVILCSPSNRFFISYSAWPLFIWFWGSSCSEAVCEQ